MRFIVLALVVWSSILAAAFTSHPWTAVAVGSIALGSLLGEKEVIA